MALATLMEVVQSSYYIVGRIMSDECSSVDTCSLNILSGEPTSSGREGDRRIMQNGFAVYIEVVVYIVRVRR